MVRVELTEKGDRLVTDLTEAHLTELHKLADALGDLLLLPGQDGQHGEPSAGESITAQARPAGAG